MPELEPAQLTVKADSVGHIGQMGDFKPLKPELRAAYYLALGVGAVIGIASFTIVVQWVVTSPWLGAPSGLADLSSEKAKVLVETLKSLSELATDRATKMFETLIAGSLLPVFTALVGYIVGSRVSGREND